jgi:hypothetical protein
MGALRKKKIRTLLLVQSAARELVCAERAPRSGGASCGGRRSAREGERRGEAGVRTAAPATQGRMDASTVARYDQRAGL